jgi:hypothetical protein
MCIHPRAWGIEGVPLDQVLVSEQFHDNSTKRRLLFTGLVINNDYLNEEDYRKTGSGDHDV